LAQPLLRYVGRFADHGSVVECVIRCCTLLLHYSRQRVYEMIKYCRDLRWS
jgi:hypothetical protein